MQHDHEWIAQLREKGWTWDQIVTWASDEEVGYTPTAKQLRQAHYRWRLRNQPAEAVEAPGIPEKGVVLQEWVRDADGTRHIKYPQAEAQPRVDAAQEIWSQLLRDFEQRTSGAYFPRPPELLIPTAPGMLGVLAINDPHFGMLAYGREVGEDQDIYTIEQDYLAAVEHHVAISRIYSPQRLVYIVGNDMAHVNQAGEGGKGGATKKGTQQDLDTRMSKIFTTMQRCAVSGIDLAASVIPEIDVIVVPGNHDPDEAFRLGCVLQAWYRNHEHVTVVNNPKKRKFYGYERNAFMFTHGEEVRRKRDNLVTIMATECPAQIWTESEGGSREIHTGHNHIRLQGGYYPTAEAEEARGVIIRSLPGLTATDAWHYEEGYKHRRAASLLMYHPQHGFSGLHEYQPTLRTR
jgi:hypothetical protein